MPTRRIPARHIDGTPLLVHVERMDDGTIWQAIYYGENFDERVVMWFHAQKKNTLEWTVSEVGS